jgi:phosphatidylglycerophosphate synthase
MFDQGLRRFKDRCLQRALPHMTCFSPNQWTLISLVVGLCSIAAVFMQLLLLGLLLFLANRALDGIDGAVARATHQQTDFGGYLDLMADFVVYAGLPLAFLFAQPSLALATATSVLLAVFYLNAASWMLLAALLDKRTTITHTTFHMPVGLIEGFETLVFYTLFFIFPQHLVALFYLMAALTSIGIVQRAHWAFLNLRHTNP